MAHWTLLPAYVPLGGVATASITTDVSTAHTKSAWQEIAASIPSGVVGIELRVSGTVVSGSSSLTLLDIGIGSAGSEFVVMENIGCGGSWLDYAVGILPITLPAGARLAVRAQSVNLNKTFTVNIRFYGSAGTTPVPSGRTWKTVAANTATSGGVGVTSGGGWTEIIASLPHSACAFLVCLQLGSNLSTSYPGATLELGIGASSAETTLRELTFDLSSTEVVTSRTSQTVSFVDIPEGSRIWARITSASGGTQVHLLTF